MSEEIKTPRTDSIELALRSRVALSDFDIQQLVTFARQLERELIQITKERDALRIQLDQADELIQRAKALFETISAKLGAKP